VQKEAIDAIVAGKSLVVVTVYRVRTSQVPRGGEMVPPHLDQHLLRLSQGANGTQP
jgi:hypothetical protein